MNFKAQSKLCYFLLGANLLSWDVHAEEMSFFFGGHGSGPPCALSPSVQDSESLLHGPNLCIFMRKLYLCTKGGCHPMEKAEYSGYILVTKKLKILVFHISLANALTVFKWWKNEILQRL